VAVAFGLLTKVTGLQTAAQWLLNSAILANPITWVVLGVLSLIADRLIVMHDGKAVESGTAQEIFDNATDTYTRHLIKQHRAVMHRFLDALHAPVPGRIPA